MVSARDFQAGYRGFESRLGRDNFQTASTPSSYSTDPKLSIKWTGRRFVTESDTKCAWVIHESKAVQIHVHSNDAASIHAAQQQQSSLVNENNDYCLYCGEIRRVYNNCLKDAK